MRINRIGILVLAAAVLAVMTSGMASAATITFDGYSKSTHRSTFPAYTAFVSNGESPAHGHKSAVGGDNAFWETRAQNYDAGTHEVRVLYSGGTLNTGYASYTVPGYSTVNNQWVTARIQSTSAFQIQEQHRYLSSGENVPTAYNNTQMNINM